MEKLYIFILISTIVIGQCKSQTSTGVNVINAVNPRTFSVDYANNQFLMDNQPFRYVSGEFHYFRSTPQSWRRKLRTMRAAGLNAVSTYVEWSLHNPQDGVYKWDGIADLLQFIQLAVEEDLYVIFRPGPYICAERDLGGFPYWLLTKYPNISLRTTDANYTNEVAIWYNELMPKVSQFLYGNGGPIIMVQIENEYGSFGCDNNYKQWLKAETQKFVGDKAVLFTNDGPAQLPCGQINGVLATLDFGAATNVDPNWTTLRRYQQNGPLVNSEYYPGWLTHWQEEMQRVSTPPILRSLKQMLDRNASVNFYMFYGGTNFEFTSGANTGGPGAFNADVTSYDYDAPMDEAGDPTAKYYALRNLIGQYLPLPNIPLPQKEPKMYLGQVTLRPVTNLLSQLSRSVLGSYRKQNVVPLKFEELNQRAGFILYETKLPTFLRDPSTLQINTLRDRAYIIVEQKYVGILSRENNITQIPLTATYPGHTLQILVENQGRINYDIPNDFKGIIGDVEINGGTLYNWTMTGFPLDNYNNIETMINVKEQNKTIVNLSNRQFLKSGPTFFHGQFTINATTIYDTYLDPTGWGKGVLFINGHNLGRYWPVIGPQITIYVPKATLKNGINDIVMLELQSAPSNGTITLTNIPNLDGYIY